MGILVLVRHGQASFLEEEYDKLSPLGEEQARRLGDYLARHGIRFDKSYTGSLARQRRTAELVGEAYARAGVPWPEPEVLDGLVEFPAEALAVRFLPALMEEDAQVREWVLAFQAAQDVAEKARYFQKGFEVLMARWARGDYGEPHVEPWPAFVARVESAIRAMTEEQPPGRRVIAFTSGGVTSVAVQRALDTDPEKTLQMAWMLRNAALTEFLFTKGRFTMSSFNDVPHLPEPEMWTFR
jgi:broad specificity phosphatase PhoE